MPLKNKVVKQNSKLWEKKKGAGVVICCARGIGECRKESGARRLYQIGYMVNGRELIAFWRGRKPREGLRCPSLPLDMGARGDAGKAGGG